MKPLTPEEMHDLRADIAHFGLSVDHADELIRMIDNIIISVIDQNNGRHSAQLSLSARANYAFNKQDSSDDISSQNKNKTVDLDENHGKRKGYFVHKPSPRREP